MVGFNYISKLNLREDNSRCVKTLFARSNGKAKTAKQPETPASSNIEWLFVLHRYNMKFVSIDPSLYAPPMS